MPARKTSFAPRLHMLGLSLVLAVCGTAAASPFWMPPEFSQQQMETLKKVKTVRLVVKESYQRAEGLTLPIIRERAEKVLKALGFEVAPPTAPKFDATVELSIAGIYSEQSPAAKFFGIEKDSAGLHGLALHVSMTLTAPGVEHMGDVADEEKAIDQRPGQAQTVDAGYVKMAEAWNVVRPLARCLSQAFAVPVSRPAIRLLRDDDARVRQWAAESLQEVTDPEAVTPLSTAATADTDAKVRGAAVAALGDTRSPGAVETIRKATQDADGNVRREAIRALGEVRDDRAMAILAGILQDPKAATPARVHAAEAMANYPALAAVPVLLGAMKDAQPEVRSAAADALGQTTHPAQDALVAAMKDPHESVRSSVAQSLGMIRGDVAESALREASADPSATVRTSVAEALGKIGGCTASQTLIGMLGDKEWLVRYAAANALCNPRDVSAVGPLADLLRDEYSTVRTAAIQALRDMGSPQAVGPLTDVLADKDPEVRRAAIDALGEIASPKAVDALTIALKDKDERAKVSAAKALGEIGDARAVPALADALKDTDPQVRQAAARALGRTGDPQALKPLLTALRDQDWNVRAGATESLSSCLRANPVPWVFDELVAMTEGPDAAVALRPLTAFGEKASPVFLQALKNADPKVRAAVAVAVADIPVPYVMEALLDVLVKDPAPQVREAAAAAMGYFRSPRSQAALLAALKDTHPPVRATAARALGWTGDDKAVDPLTAVAEKDPDQEVRYAARKAIKDFLVRKAEEAAKK